MTEHCYQKFLCQNNDRFVKETIVSARANRTGSERYSMCACRCLSVMSTSSSKRVSHSIRRTWDTEAYEKKAQERIRQEQEETASDDYRRKASQHFLPGHTVDPLTAEVIEDKPEFKPAPKDAAGPENSKERRAFLQARTSRVADIDERIGSTEMVSAEDAVRTSTKKETPGPTDAVVKTGVGWHCKVCDCFLKDSHTYLDHINGRKHQRKLGYSMQVSRSTADDMRDRLKKLAAGKRAAEEKKEKMIQRLSNAGFADASQEDPNFDRMVKAKDEALEKQRAERKKQRKERRKRIKEEKHNTINSGTMVFAEHAVNEKVVQDPIEDDGEVDVAALMGFSGFGGSSKNG